MPNSSLKKKWLCKITKNTLPVSDRVTDRVHWPSAIVRVTPLYWMCERVVYLRVAFLHHYDHIHTANVCEKFVNCERICLYEPRVGNDMRTKAQETPKDTVFNACRSVCPSGLWITFIPFPIETSIIFSLSTGGYMAANIKACS